MNNKFLDKVIYQIISETRIIGGKLYTPFLPFPLSSSLVFLPLLPSSRPLPSPLPFSKHCKEVYSLNEQEIKYVWVKYKEGLTALMDKKELSYE